MTNVNLTLDALCKFIEDNKNKINKKNKIFKRLILIR